MEGEIGTVLVGCAQIEAFTSAVQIKREKNCTVEQVSSKNTFSYLDTSPSPTVIPCTHSPSLKQSSWNAKTAEAETNKAKISFIVILVWFTDDCYFSCLNIKLAYLICRHMITILYD